MRLADVILRRGHLSEQALAESYVTGERPVHLDRCDVCAERAVLLGRWLDDIRTVGIEEADTQLPPERLAAQKTQILRRLEHVDRPARVITFPGSARDRLDTGSHGIRPAWVGIAAAAGLLIGLLGGQFTARLSSMHGALAHLPVPVQQNEATSNAAPTQASIFEIPDLDQYDNSSIDYLAALEAYTPHAIARSEPVVLRTTRMGQ